MNPLSEQVIKALRAAPPEGLAAHELGQALSADRKMQHQIRATLDELVADNQLERAPGSRFRVVGDTRVSTSKWPVTGRLRVHPSGFGFVMRDDSAGGDDVYVAARWRGSALDGDRVGLTTWVGYKGTEGKVEAVLERGRARLTGIVRGRGNRAYLEPDDPRILASFEHIELEGDVPRGAEDQAVLVEITRYPEHDGEPLVATLRMVIGQPESLQTEITKILVVANIETDFMPPVVNQAAGVPQALIPSDFENRTDLRHLTFLTIDPETARDFDDAVCVEDSPRAGCDRIWVAVADVSHYVRPGTPIDDEAQRRGCSVYLPDRAIPMLPKELSAQICSLNPEVDRCAMVARMDIDAEGAVHDEFFCAAAIRSRARFDYAGVAASLGGDVRGPREKYIPFLPTLERLRGIGQRLRGRRLVRGSLDFDLPEAKIILDEDDPTRIRDVVQSRADPLIKGAYQLVEDFMLAANEAVARRLRERGSEALWRIHEPPSAERLETFAAVAGAYGIQFDVEDGRDPKKVRDLLKSLHGRPMEQSLSTLLLRSLKQAMYDTTNKGHFGLAAPDYVHFTSPIRRYPDLVIHRLLKRVIAAEGGDAGGTPLPVPIGEDLQRVANQTSQSERRAMQAERDVVDLFRAYFMRDRVGEELPGKVTGLTGFGAFVTIEHPYVEGLVRMESLRDDRYVFEERTLRLVGQHSGRAISLGDPVKVRIDAVSIARRKIDLSLIDRPVPRIPESWLDQEAEYARNREESRKAITTHRIPTARDPRDQRNSNSGDRPPTRNPNSGPERGERPSRDSGSRDRDSRSSKTGPRTNARTASKVPSKPSTKFRKSSKPSGGGKSPSRSGAKGKPKRRK